MSLKKKTGFSLVQMAVIVSVLGIALTNGAILGQKYLEKKRYEVTDQRLKVVEDAIIGYAARYGYFPCPSGLTETLSDVFNKSSTYHTSRAASQAECTHSGIFTSSDGDFYMGGVPWQELSLPYEYALDGWGRKNIYAMPKTFYEKMTVESYSAVPDTISNIELWFDAADLSNFTLSGSVPADYYSVAHNVKVSELLGSETGSSKSLGVSGTPSGDQPVFYIHESGSDKFPVMRFDGVDDELEILGNSYSSEISNFTVFATVRFTTTEPSGEMFISYDNEAYYEFGIRNAATDRMVIRTHSSVSTGYVQGSTITNFNDGEFHHFSAHFEYDGTDQIKLFENNVEAASGSPHESGGVDYNVGSGSPGTRYGFVGVASDATSTPATSTGGAYFTGDIAELIVYSQTLSNTDRTTVYNYLSDKWDSNLITTEGPFLTVNDVSDTELTDEAIFVLLSTGPTGEGGYTKDGVALTDPDGGETEYNNIPIASFPSTLYAAAARDSADYRQRYNIDDFDDIVRYAIFDQIKDYKDNRRVN